MNYLLLVLFYIFAVLLLFSAIKVVTVKNPVKAALWLVLTFALSSGEWILIQADFLGILLLLVYVGAVMVLFLFVIMMINVDIETLRAGFWRNLPVSLLIGIIVIAVLLLIFLSPQTQLNAINSFEPVDINHSSLKALAQLLYSENYRIAIELSAILLLLGMVAAISLVHRKEEFGKRTFPGHQVKVNPKRGRIQLRKLPVEVEKENEPTREEMPSSEEEQS